MSDVEVSRVIAAGADELYDIVSDLPRMGDLSPENQGGQWVKGATGPSVGACFKGKNANAGKTWSTLATVEHADRGKRFEFTVKGGPLKIARWGYRFEPTDGGTKVTETWDDPRGWLAKKVGPIASGVSDRAAHNRATMEATLERLASRFESAAG